MSTSSADWNTGHPQTWGTIGHYLIGARACSAVTNTNLRELLTNNIDRISVSDDEIIGRNLNQQPGFIALADVADIAWRKPANFGGRPEDGHNHFADMDRAGLGEFAGKTLMGLTESAHDLDPEVWNRFYESLGIEEEHKGALPYRTWQIYNDMVTYLKAGRIVEFVCAAGILAHYVGDACQPLHVSRFHNGYAVDEGSDDPAHPLPAGISLNMEKKVHANYEEEMLEGTVTAELIARVDNALDTAELPNLSIVDGASAGMAVVDLMKRVFGTLSPCAVVDCYNDAVLEFSPSGRSSDEDVAGSGRPDRGVYGRRRPGAGRHLAGRLDRGQRRCDRRPERG